jgi:hypothetical protein
MGSPYRDKKVVVVLCAFFVRPSVGLQLDGIGMGQHEIAWSIALPGTCSPTQHLLAAALMSRA